MLKAHEWKEVELHTHVLDPLKVRRVCWSLVKVSNVDALLSDTLVDELRKNLFIVALLEKCPKLGIRAIHSGAGISFMVTGSGGGGCTFCAFAFLEVVFHFLEWAGAARGDALSSASASSSGWQSNMFSCPKTTTVVFLTLALVFRSYTLDE